MEVKQKPPTRTVAQKSAPKPKGGGGILLLFLGFGAGCFMLVLLVVGAGVIYALGYFDSDTKPVDTPVAQNTSTEKGPETGGKPVTADREGGSNPKSSPPATEPEKSKPNKPSGGDSDPPSADPVSDPTLIKPLGGRDPEPKTRPDSSTPPADPPAEADQPRHPREGKLVRNLPGTVSSAMVGGAGRYWVLHLARERKLAIFDVIAGRIARYITLPADNIKYAAGQDKLVVVLPDTNIVQRWDLATGERELSVPLAVQGTIKGVSMGSASQGPVYIGIGQDFRSELRFLDLGTLKPLTLKMPERQFHLGDVATVRASADGKTFGRWSPGTSPQGINLITITGSELKQAEGWDSAGHVVPGPDGKTIYTARGLFNDQAKHKGDANDKSYCLPAAQGDLYLTLDLPGFRQKKQARVSIYMPGDPPRPLCTLPNIETPTDINPWDREQFGNDQRFLFLPTEGLLATIPTSSDRVVVHYFDLGDLLEKSGTDYLLVTSAPTTRASKGAAYSYSLVARSKKGGLKYRVDSGPEGMTVSADGVVKWKVPASFAEREVDVIINVSDSSGQEVFHGYKVSLGGTTVARAPDATSPADVTKTTEKPDSTSPATPASDPKPPADSEKLRGTKSEEKVVRRLPGTVNYAMVGGGGRYWILHLPRERKLAIFDVIAGRIARYIPLTEDNIKFAAGQDKLVIALPDTNIIQRWDLAKGERELAVPLPVQGTIKGLCMGSGSQGPVYLGIGQDFRSEVRFLDLGTLKPLTLKMPESAFFLGDVGVVRASTDGKTFGQWSPGTSPQGINLMTITGSEVKQSGSGDSAGHVVPGPDGKTIFTAQGLFTDLAKRKGDANDKSYCIPAIQGDLYLSLDLPGFGQRDKSGRASIYMPSDPPRPLATLPSIDMPTDINPWDREQFGNDQRFLFLPTEGLLATIPTSSDRVVVHHFDLVDLLEKSGTDYLLVTSAPTTRASKGAAYSYSLVARSKKGGLKYRVDSGPEGMTVSADGVVKWKVPASFAEREVDVIINVSDSSGQEVFHGYKVSLGGTTVARAPDATSPGDVTKTSDKPPKDPPATPTNPPAQAEPEEPTASGIMPPPLSSDKVVKAVPTSITDVVVGGGGRYLVLNLERDRKLAIFDVNSARITQYIPLTADSVKIAAGQDKLVVLIPETSVIQRYDLATGQKELSLPVAARGKIGFISMGSASQGPIFVGMPDTLPSVVFLDLRTLRPFAYKMPDRGIGLMNPTFVRASGDGRLFGMWRPNVSPQGIATVALMGKEARLHYEHDSAGHITPDTDGKVLCTAHGLYTSECKPLNKAAEGSYCILSVQSGYYLNVNLGGPIPGRGNKGTISLYLSGADQPLFTLSQVELPSGMNGWDREAFGFDKHILFIPDAKLLVVVPETNDKLVLYRVDIVKELEESGVDYLVVTSQPLRTAKRGSDYSYQVRARAKKGAIKYRLDSGPPGMTISEKGLLQWKVPAKADTDNPVIVAVTDSEGQERLQSFSIRATGK